MELTKFLDFGTAIQIILVVVIIIQTGYIGSTMKMNRRKNQYQLTIEWNQKLRNIYHNKPVLNTNDPYIYENEYQDLIYLFQDMHILFKDKLLKSSDFFIMFMRLYTLTMLEANKKSSVFLRNHMILNTIYHDFNNIDVGMMLFHYSDNDTIDEIIKSMNENSFQRLDFENLKTTYPKIQRWIKLGLWFKLKIKKEQLFKLPSIE